MKKHPDDQFIEIHPIFKSGQDSENLFLHSYG